MAVESFTATAPFVQIGRFFLSAGESQASCRGVHPKAFQNPLAFSRAEALAPLAGPQPMIVDIRVQLAPVSESYSGLGP